WKTQVASAANHLRVVLYDGYRRHAWKALGYASWTECLRAIADEYGLTERRLWQLHTANEIEAALNHGSVGDLPERHLRELARVPPEQRAEVLDAAAANGPVTAAGIRAAADPLAQIDPQERKLITDLVNELTE